MKIHCPKCQAPFRRSKKHPNLVLKSGSFYRTSDRKHVQRLFCKLCSLHFSVATLSVYYKQKKRQINHLLAKVLVSGVSQRQCARLMKINKKTVVRKFRIMGTLAETKLQKLNEKRPKTSVLEFDDLESFEHTKCKPLSVTLAVEHKTRWILGCEVARMPAKGLLTKISLKKYGKREDKRPEARKRLFERISSFVHNGALIKSDQNPHYVEDVKRYFEESEHVRFKGRDGCIVGQGELKKTGFDPLFSLNHTCAMMRYKMSRLIRRTWNTTKKPESLKLHLALMILDHNLSLKSPCFSTG